MEENGITHQMLIVKTRDHGDTKKLEGVPIRMLTTLDLREGGTREVVREIALGVTAFRERRDENDLHQCAVVLLRSRAQQASFGRERSPGPRQKPDAKTIPCSAWTSLTFQRMARATMKRTRLVIDTGFSPKRDEG
jgi:hypothetical protein